MSAALAIAVVAVGALLQGTVGFGLALVAAPLLVLLDPLYVPGPLLMAALVLALLMSYRERREVDLGMLRWAVVGRIAGGSAAAYLLASLPKEPLALLFAGLVLLGVALTLFFLDRDGYKLGRNFYLAALLCGMTAAIKVIGFFFFLAIFIYLLLALRHRKLTLRQLVRPALIFLLIVLVVFVLLNPLLLIPHTRAQILKVQQEQNYFVTHGWEDEDTYETGLASWLPYLRQWYALPVFTLFLLLSLGVGICRNRQQPIYWLLLGWIIPYSLYLILFVAIKPTHYWLPTFIPLLSNALVLVPDDLFSKPFNFRKISSWAALVCFLLIGWQSADYLKKDARLLQRTMEKERLLLACNSQAENPADGSAVMLDPVRWYRLESYDARTQPARRDFTFTQGNLSVTAFADHGQLAWACTNEGEARFSAERSAEIYRESHPREQVLFNQP